MQERRSSGGGPVERFLQDHDVESLLSSFDTTRNAAVRESLREALNTLQGYLAFDNSEELREAIKRLRDELEDWK